MEDSNSTHFARAFGDALEAFLQAKGISHADVARKLGLGKRGVSRLGTYCHDAPNGTRATPSAAFLYQVCSGLNFEFEYNGYRVSEGALNGRSPGRKEAPAEEQLSFEFDGQFNLTEDKGAVSVSVRRPPGRIEISLSLKAIS